MFGFCCAKKRGEIIEGMRFYCLLEVVGEVRGQGGCLLFHELLEKGEAGFWFCMRCGWYSCGELGFGEEGCIVLEIGGHGGGEEERFENFGMMGVTIDVIV